MCVHLAIKVLPCARVRIACTWKCFQFIMLGREGCLEVYFNFSHIITLIRPAPWIQRPLHFCLQTIALRVCFRDEKTLSHNCESINPPNLPETSTSRSIESHITISPTTITFTQFSLVVGGGSLGDRRRRRFVFHVVIVVRRRPTSDVETIHMQWSSTSPPPTFMILSASS